MLILTEKPSVAASFAAALNVPRSSDHCGRDRFENGGHCIVHAVGHLLEDYMPQDYDPRYEKWRLEDLPIIPDEVKLKPAEKTQSVLDTIKRCFDAHRGDELLLATDAEREGELIGAEILEYVGFKDYAKARRFWVSEALTPDVVLRGIKDAKPLSEYASYKEQGKARQSGDWLVGMNLSRLVSLGTNGNFAVGRVQSAVLNAVYERCAHIAAFKKEPYFELLAKLKADSEFTARLLNPANAENPHRFTGADELLKKAASEIKTPGEGKITSLSKEKTTEPPPKLFNLTALQKEAHKRLNLSPEETLNTARPFTKNTSASPTRAPRRE
jgi:DNA topoisomerase-3